MEAQKHKRLNFQSNAFVHECAKSAFYGKVLTDLTTHELSEIYSEIYSNNSTLELFEHAEKAHFVQIDMNKILDKE